MSVGPGLQCPQLLIFLLQHEATRCRGQPDFLGRTYWMTQNLTIYSNPHTRTSKAEVVYILLDAWNCWMETPVKKWSMPTISPWSLPPLRGEPRSFKASSILATSCACWSSRGGKKRHSGFDWPSMIFILTESWPSDYGWLSSWILTEN